MPRNSRSDNQYYGKFFECCVVSEINNTDIEYKENFSFSDAEKLDIIEDAKKVAELFKNNKATYLGDKTATGSGDILLDSGENIELKYVSSGSGTYFNTSIYYFEKFGFSFKTYLKENGYYDILEENFGDKINISKKNNSPVSRENSSYIRHNFTELYKTKIVPADEKIRKIFINDIINYFKNNEKDLYIFINDMLTKSTNTSKKNPPDKIIVFNYNKGTITELNWKNFIDKKIENIVVNDKGFVINNNIRIQISWQNGIGLNNPTIRVFLA